MIENMHGKTSTVKPGEHGVIRLNADDIAVEIRAKSIPPYHYEKN